MEAAVFISNGQLVLTGDNKGVLRTWNGDTGEAANVFESIKDPGRVPLGRPLWPAGRRTDAVQWRGHRCRK